MHIRQQLRHLNIYHSCWNVFLRYLSICVWSFVMVHNNKKAGAICRCHITFCVQNQYLWFSKFPIFRNIWIYPNWFYVFLKCGILRNCFSISQRNVGFLLCRLFIKKNYYDRYYNIKQTMRKNGSFHGLFTVSFGPIDPCDVTQMSMRVFVTTVHSPQLFTACMIHTQQKYSN